MIPDRNMRIAFAALYAVGVKSFDPDGMHTKGNDTEKPETIREYSAGLPYEVAAVFNGNERCIRSGDILKRFQTLKP